MDIKGPMDMMSIGKYLYFLILVDDYSGLTGAYPMQKKSDALKCYRGFAGHAWNQTGKRIDYLRCDKAKEFLSSEFNEYLCTQGTVLQRNYGQHSWIDGDCGKKYPHYHEYDALYA